MKTDQSGFGTVGVLVVVVILGIIGGIGWSVWNSSANNSSTQSSSKAIKNEGSPAQDDEQHFIHELKLAIKLNDQTTDLISKVKGGDTAFFTLKGFLERANQSGYSAIYGGKNACEELAYITVFKDASEVRQHGTEITGELIDDQGQPVQNRVTLLADGRYILATGSQAPCNNNTALDGTPLSEENSEARTAILNVLRNNITATE